MGQDKIDELELRLEDVLEAVKRDLGTVRAGRAKAGLVEGIKVEAYGSMMGMREVANINVPDATLIVIAPWDKSLREEVAKAVKEAGLGLNPLIDGDAVKVPVPALTEERRKELVKLVAQKIESGRVMVRQVRGEVKEEIEKLKDQGGVSEDDIHNWLEQMQKKIDLYIGKIEEAGEDKEKDLMTI